MTRSFRYCTVFFVLLVLDARVFAQEKEVTPLQTRNYRDEARRIFSASGGALRLVKRSESGAPSILLGTSTKDAELISLASRNNAQDVSLAARAWVGSISTPILGLPADAELRERTTERSGDLWLSSFDLLYNGISVRERSLYLNIGALNGRILMVRNNLPVTLPNMKEPRISPEAVLLQTENIMGSGARTQTPHLVYVHRSVPERLLLCYEVLSRSARGNELYRLSFDAATGELIEKKDLLYDNCFRYDPSRAEENAKWNSSITIVNPPAPAVAAGGASGRLTATVHLATPFDTLTTVGLPFTKLRVNNVPVVTDSAGYWSLASVQSPLAVAANFKSPYHYITRIDTTNSSLSVNISSGLGNILWDSTNSDPAERDAFYSVARVHTHVRALDAKLTNLDTMLEVNVNYDATCNAFYDPDSISLTFFIAGGGCVNTAEIADVVYHEFGHRVAHARYNQAAGKEANIVDGSLGEGFADLVSSFMRDDPRIGIGFFGMSTTLRNCNNTYKFPKDLSGDPHANGSIIAGAFWDLRKTMGLAQTEKLFHMMMYQRPDGPGDLSEQSTGEAFTNTLLATLITDDDNNDLTDGTPNMSKILAAFDKHNITLGGLINLSLEKIPDEDSSALSYPVAVTASFDSPIGGLDTSSVILHYRKYGGTAFTDLKLSKKDSVHYVTSIGKFPSGTVIEYYVSAATNISASSLKETPAKNEPYYFLIGYKRRIFDDLEISTGWTSGIPSDAATTGIWAFGKPNGTFFYFDSTFFVQQDTDHTPNGTKCFVTGNAPTTTPSDDDVDGGSTTLTSRAYDLSQMKQPFIRYWYYFSNNTGSNPDVSPWATQVSTDDGSTWENVQSTTTSTNGWQQYGFPLSEYGQVSDKMRLRFIATDNIGSLVEAGVDDIEVLDPLLPSEDVRAEHSIKGTDLSAYPNPLSSNVLRIKLYSAEKLYSSIILRDLLGNIVDVFESGRDIEGDYEHEYRLDPGIANGLYFLEWNNGTGIVRIKIVLAR
jgi:hypothetical protein